MIAPVLYRVYDICNSNPHQNMKVFLKFAVICLLSAGLFSCQKEKSFEIPLPGTDNGDDDSTTNPADNKLIGTWKFINFDVDVAGIVDVSAFGQTAGSRSAYSTVTLNNTGTITFDANKANITGLGYDISTDVKVTTYTGSVQEDELTMPLDFTAPPYNASSKYKIIGTDSLYFPEGTLFEMPDAGLGEPTGAAEPMGAKFSINGNTLLISTSVSRDSSFVQNGLTYTVTQQASGTIKLERQ